MGLKEEMNLRFGLKEINIENYIENFNDTNYDIQNFFDKIVETNPKLKLKIDENITKIAKAHLQSIISVSIPNILNSNYYYDRAKVMLNDKKILTDMANGKCKYDHFTITVGGSPIQNHYDEKNKTDRGLDVKVTRHDSHWMSFMFDLNFSLSDEMLNKLYRDQIESIDFSNYITIFNNNKIYKLNSDSSTVYVSDNMLNKKQFVKTLIDYTKTNNLKIKTHIDLMTKLKERYLQCSNLNHDLNYLNFNMDEFNTDAITTEFKAKLASSILALGNKYHISKWHGYNNSILDIYPIDLSECEE